MNEQNPCYVIRYQNETQELEGYLRLEFWCHGAECWILTDVLHASRFTAEGALSRIKDGALDPLGGIDFWLQRYSLSCEDFDPADCVLIPEHVPAFDMNQLSLLEVEHVHN